MTSEHDRHVELEVKHNIVALDPETITPWSLENTSEMSRDERINRFGEGLVLAIWKRELIEDLQGLDDRIDEIVETLRLNFETECQMHGIEEMAREKVRNVWTHSA